jgi:hypothetical protein
MSRTVTQAFKQAVFAEETEEAFLILLTIDHTDLSAPIRVVDNMQDITSRGDLFVGFPFEIALPSDTDDGPPRARLRIDNVDQSIVQALRSISSAPSVHMELVRASDPDTVEADFPDFELKVGRYDVLTVEGELGQESYLAEPYPAGRFDPARFPGLF